ncbi:ComEC/Rec2 family competence protein [Halalkalibacter kiskunsagensis]|uniref:ComEC/Rec2 family competence protein n=1 Tax=Halalkalibacter kiskunsagensis TaxID=1548599 RepID=A0ABV6KAB0_9BACI
MRKVLIGLVCLIVMSVTLGMDIRLVVNSSDTEAEVELDLQLEEDDVGFVFLDLPNGEATYLELPNEGSMLIGTGSKDSADALFLRLKKLNVSTVDTIILPRFEKEYSGNVEEVLSQLQTKTIVVPEQGLDQAISQYQKYNVDIIGWEESEIKELASHVSVKILPDESAIMPMLTFIITIHDSHQFFFASDASEKLEYQWIKKGLSPVSILKVAEFGTDEGTTQRFLNEIDPQVAILFSKKNGDVSAQLLERLQETWIDTYQTKQNGSVIVKVNKFDYEIVTVHFKD